MSGLNRGAGASLETAKVRVVANHAGDLAKDQAHGPSQPARSADGHTVAQKAGGSGKKRR